MKKKAMIMAVASLGSMALIGTGFAGWVISANTSTNAKGVITAYDVKDQRLTISNEKWTTEKTAGSGSIIFGKPKTEDTFEQTPWFTFTNGVEEEVLSNTFTFNVASGDTGETGKFKVAAEIVVEDTKANTAWQNAITKNVVAAPVVAVGGTEGVYTLAAAPTAVTIDLTFNWGSHFESKNPYNFYNKKTIGEKIDTAEGQTKTWGDDANEFMTHFNAITEVNFTLKITVTRQ